jgi:xanthine dehydrogenase accessory factor
MHRRSDGSCFCATPVRWAALSGKSAAPWYLDPMTAPGPLAVLAEAERASREQGRAVLCQVVRADGSTPGKVGWKLLVRGDGSAFGNLGGGAFEAMVIADARERLGEDTGAPAVKRYYLTETAVQGEPTGMVCGGMMEVLLEVLTAPPLLVVCGGGPVGQAVAQAAALAGFDRLVAEDREAFREPSRFPEGTRFAAVGREFLEDFLAEARGRELYVALVSRCWQTDAAALASVLRQRPVELAYLGLMGSRRKIARVRREVEARGFGLEGLPWHAPIGLPIGGDAPGEIAISILAEIVRERCRRRAGAPAALAEPSASLLTT